MRWAILILIYRNFLVRSCGWSLPSVNRAFLFLFFHFIAITVRFISAFLLTSLFFFCVHYQLNWRRRAQNLKDHLLRPYLVRICYSFWDICLSIQWSINALETAIKQIIKWFQKFTSHDNFLMQLLLLCHYIFWFGLKDSLIN